MNVHKVLVLTPPLEPDSLYYVEDGDDSQAYITDNAGVAKNVTNAQAAEILASQAHIATVTGNPHAVTKANVGLSNVDNTSDADKPVSTATQTALDDKADDADLTTHTGNTANPHSVTKAQVGLSDADNTSDLAKPISTLTQTALDNKQDDIDQDLNTTDSPTFEDLTLTGLLHVDAVVARVANSAANQQSIPQNTWTALSAVFDDISFDPNSIWNVDRFQPTIPSYYAVDGIWIMNIGVAATQITGLYKNGVLHAVLGRGSSNTSSASGFSGSDVVYMNGTTDYIQLYAFSGAVGAETMGNAGYNRFSITRIGD